jgi:hypothetical protein
MTTCSVASPRIARGKRFPPRSSRGPASRQILKGDR